VSIEIWIIIALAVVALVGLLAFGTTWLAFYSWLHRDLGGAPNLDRVARRVRIALEDGDALDGWFLPGRNHAMVLVLHGYGRDHHRAWRYGSFLNRAGYGVVAFDFRSSRSMRSGGRKPTTLGHHELPDARAALRWVRERGELAGCTIGVFGESLGGTVALLLAAESPEVAAVVVDCAFATGAHALEDSSERWARVPRWPTAAIARSVGRVLTGFDPGAVDGVSAAALLEKRPLFFIHSLNDNRFSADQPRMLWRAAGSKDPLWWIPDVGHNEGWIRLRGEYERRVLAFLDRHLRGVGEGLATDGSVVDGCEGAPAEGARGA